MNNCRYCGLEIAADAVRCPNCGAENPLPAADTVLPSRTPPPPEYDRRLLKDRARKAFHANYWVCLGVSLLGWLILNGVRGTRELGDWLKWQGLESPYWLLGSLLALLLYGVIQYGLMNFFLDIFRGRGARFRQLFDGFARFGKTCGAGLLVILLVSLGTLLLIVPGIVLFYAYSMTFYLLREHPELTVTQAMAAGRHLMDGHKTDLFVLDLSYIGWLLLGILTCGLLLLFYVIPWLHTARAGFYDLIKSEYAAP